MAPKPASMNRTSRSGVSPFFRSTLRAAMSTAPPKALTAMVWPLRSFTDLIGEEASTP